MYVKRRLAGVRKERLELSVVVRPQLLTINLAIASGVVSPISPNAPFPPDELLGRNAVFLLAALITELGKHLILGGDTEARFLHVGRVVVATLHDDPKSGRRNDLLTTLDAHEDLSDDGRSMNRRLRCVDTTSHPRQADLPPHSSLPLLGVVREDLILCAGAAAVNEVDLILELHTGKRVVEKEKAGRSPLTTHHEHGLVFMRHHELVDPNGKPNAPSLVLLISKCCLQNAIHGPREEGSCIGSATHNHRMALTLDDRVAADVLKPLSIPLFNGRVDIGIVVDSKNAAGGGLGKKKERREKT